MTMVRRPGRLREARGMTLIELSVVLVILGILLMIGIATLLRARTSANESAAINALRTINTAQFQYNSGCGRGDYAASLVILGTKPPGNKQGYLSEDLGASDNPVRSGYRFNVRRGVEGTGGFLDCNGTATETTYYAVAIPMVLGQTGTRAFATNQKGSIWQLPGAVPPVEPFGPPAQLVQ
jgi:prepilin-type N-terminal cleavage/methylation domain-containing protein